MKEDDVKKAKKALIKRALGYDAKETVEEYVKGEDGIILTKKKVTKKPVPPDVSALKVLLELEPDKAISNMSEEELVLERERLLRELSQAQEKEEKICKKKSKKNEKSSMKK
ncbi:MAG: hypothetical protein IJW43_01950 [Clostridia bacterium]|nr:hypothetical protein [Clostridia bacterium]